MADRAQPDAGAGPWPVVLNAWGRATPYGVSRSPAPVADAAAWALTQHLDIAGLQALVSEQASAATSFEAACVTHCTASAITLGVAATMTGTDRSRIAQLPDTAGLRSAVVVLDAHATVDFGQPVEQAIRLSGAQVRRAADLVDLDRLSAAPDVTAVLAVDSSLVVGPVPSTAEIAEIAHRHGRPLLLDAAAQDMRLPVLAETGADLVAVSAHKYLAAPTAGLVLGSLALVSALDAQHRGIGRAMKPTKEALVGVLAALQHRRTADLDVWRQVQAAKVETFLGALRDLPDVTLERRPDPSGNGFDRVRLTFSPDGPRRLAALTDALGRRTPPVVLNPRGAEHGVVTVELTGLDEVELDEVIAALLTEAGG